MGAVYFSIPKPLVRRIRERLNIRNFIETGTFRGNTAIWAAGIFERVYTIEIDPEIRKETAQRKDATPNIEFLLGNSAEVLPEVVSKLSGPCFFWLDGHWCVGAGDQEAHECPLLQELEAIASLQGSVIFIDDARCFLGPLPPPHRTNDWPRIDEVFEKLGALFPGHRTTIIDDVILCYPPAVQDVIDQYWLETYHSRFSSIRGRLQGASRLKLVRYLLGIGD